MPFQKGQVANPNGRPRRTRDRLTEAFLRDMEHHWRLNGPKALDEALERDPNAYLRVIASMVPKDMVLRVEDNPLAELSDEQLAAVIDLAERLAGAEGGVVKANGTEQPDRLH